MKQIIKLTVNNQEYELLVASNKTLLEVIRDDLGLTGTKKGCDSGECGACTVLLDDMPVLSCITLACEADGRQIQTVEGLTKDGELHPVQKAFIEHGAIQCGFCTPAMLLTAEALLKEHPQPTLEEVRTAISGNICRCTGYVKIIKAIKEASETTKKDTNDAKLLGNRKILSQD